MPLHHHATEASYSASRTRRAAPSARQLAQAKEYRGCYFWQRPNVRNPKFDIWFPMFASEGDGWDWAASETLARLIVDRRLDAAEKLAARRSAK